MKLKHVLFPFIILWSSILYSQDKEVFEPDLPWMTWEEALQANPDSVLYLDLSHSKLKELPPQLYTFTHLKALSLNGLKLGSIPLAIGNFSDLTYVNFSKNNLMTFPIVICQLEQLETVVVSRNVLEQLPECIGNLKHLKYLDLWYTEVVDLPKSMDDIKGLLYIDLRGININPVTQATFLTRFPKTKFELDPPCNCFH